MHIQYRYISEYVYVYVYIFFTVNVYIHLNIYLYIYLYSYLYSYLHLYLYPLYSTKKVISKLLVRFFELLASFSCTWNRNRNCIPNTVPVPVLESVETLNEYGSDLFRFRLRNPGWRIQSIFGADL
jgi:hypothetical protein